MKLGRNIKLVIILKKRFNRSFNVSVFLPLFYFEVLKYFGN